MDLKKKPLKYIICGLEHLGLRVAESLIALQEEVRVITLSADELHLHEIKDSLSLYVQGDARRALTLEASGISEANVFMALTTNDITNLEIIAQAKRLNPSIVAIIRLTNDDVGEEIKKGFGVCHALSVAQLAALPFVLACFHENVVHVFFHHQTIGFVGSLTVSDKSSLGEKTVGEAESDYDIKIKLLYRPDVGLMAPQSDETIRCHDTALFVAADKEALDKLSAHAESFKDDVSLFTQTVKRQFFRKLSSIPWGVQFIGIAYAVLFFASLLVFQFGMDISTIDALYFVITTTTTVGYGDFNLKDSPTWLKLYGAFVMLFGALLMAALFGVIADLLISRRFAPLFGLYWGKFHDHVIVVGVGNFGSKIINLLYESGLSVVAIEKNSQTSFVYTIHSSIPALFSDALNPQVLIRAGVTKAQTIIAAGDDDLKNIKILLQARQLNPKIRTIGRIFSREVGLQAQKAMKIDRVVSTSSISSPFFIGAALHENAVSALSWQDVLLIVLKIKSADYPFLTVHTIGEIAEKFGLHTLSVYSDDKTFIPSRDYRLKDDDEILIMGDYHKIHRLKAKD